MRVLIVRKIRAQAMPDARLLMVGSPVDGDYTRRLHRVAARDRDWIDFREDLPRAELNTLMGRCRYGIQAMEHEHFGMASAEMARAGCIVARIGAVARDGAARDAIRWRLQNHAATFSTERFVDEFHDIVDEWERRHQGGPYVS